MPNRSTRQPGDQMELRQLRVFLAVADERSFTRAAERLFLTQSAVSTSVQVLEREIGATLIDRTVQPVALTAAGRAFAEYARQIMIAAEKAVQVARQELGGSLSVGFMNARRFRVPTVPGLIESFRKAHPAVTVSARHVGSSLREAEEVRDGHLDLAVLCLGGVSVPGVRVRTLWEEPIAFVCSRRHALSSTSSVRLQELRSATFVSLPSTWGVTLTVDDWLRHHRTSLQVAHVVNDPTALLDFVHEGDSAALLPVSFIPDEAAVRVLPLVEGPTFLTQLATPTHRSASAASGAFASWVQERVRRHFAA